MLNFLEAGKEGFETRLKFKRAEVSPEEKRQIALRRAAQLKARIEDYLEAGKKIQTGLTVAEEVAIRKERILEFLKGSEEDWRDWRWQVRKRISRVEDLQELLDLSEAQACQLEEVGKRFRWGISPYYLSLIRPGDPSDPLWRQAVPDYRELQDLTPKNDDPMAEELTSPAPCLTRRYPDRLIINVTNQCAMFCRHCQRRRNIGEVDGAKGRRELEAALEYIRDSEEIRDVLITGGDALLLGEERLDWLLSELDAIPHVEIKRIGTRTPVTLPQRITLELCSVLEKHPPIYLNTQFNHPRELTPEAFQACSLLAGAGVVLGNQAVLLKGVNNNVYVMKKLNQELLRARVRPYYIFHAKEVTGTGHFVTRIEEGMEIMENLRGFTSGLAVPTYIINAPHGLGKTPLLPTYLISLGEDNVRMRTWENRVLEYPNRGGD